MKILPQIANDIVIKNMQILGKNINIMDDQGFIIASGQKDRINKYHKIAHEVVKSGKTIEVDFEQARIMSDVFHGINMPIEFNGKIIGVVGITGDLKEVRNYGTLLKNTVELMLNQDFLNKILHMKDRNKEHLIHDLLLGDLNNNEFEACVSRCRVLGLIITTPATVIVINVNKTNVNLTEKMNDDQLIIEKIKDSILSILKNQLSGDDMCVTIGSEQIVVFKGIPSYLDEKRSIKHIFDFTEKIQTLINKKLNINLYIGIGEVAKTIYDIRKSYKTACYSLKIGTKFYSTENFYCLDNVTIGMLIEGASDLLKEKINKIASSKVFAKEEICETLKIYFESNFNVNKAAKRLYIHRNTLLYRLKKIEESTKLSPSNFNDAVILYLSIVFKRSRKI